MKTENQLVPALITEHKALREDYINLTKALSDPNFFDKVSKEEYAMLCVQQSGMLIHLNALSSRLELHGVKLGDGKYFLECDVIDINDEDNKRNADNH